MIGVITFDLGGILFTGRKPVITEKLAELYNYDKEIVFKILSSPEIKNLRNGETLIIMGAGDIYDDVSLKLRAKN